MQFITRIKDFVVNNSFLQRIRFVQFSTTKRDFVKTVEFEATDYTIRTD